MQAYCLPCFAILATVVALKWAVTDRPPFYPPSISSRWKMAVASMVRVCSCRSIGSHHPSGTDMSSILLAQILPQLASWALAMAQASVKHDEAAASSFTERF